MLAARVQPPMIETEMVDMFMGTLQGSILQHLAGGSSSGFSELVMSGERVENLIKLGKLPGGESSSSNTRKPFANAQKKREGDSNAVTSQRGQGRGYQTQYHQAASVTIPQVNPNDNSKFLHSNRVQDNINQDRG